MGDISEGAAARIFDILTEVRDRGIRTEERTATMLAAIGRIDHTVHGNGEIGLDERVRNLEANQQMATSAAMKVAQWLMPVALTVMGAGAIVWIKDALGMAVNK